MGSSLLYQFIELPLGNYFRSSGFFGVVTFSHGWRFNYLAEQEAPKTQQCNFVRFACGG